MGCIGGTKGALRTCVRHAVAKIGQAKPIAATTRYIYHQGKKKLRQDISLTRPGGIFGVGRLLVFAT